MRLFQIERAAQLEFDEAAAWYESERDGLGLEFMIRRGNVDPARWRRRL